MKRLTEYSVSLLLVMKKVGIIVAMPSEAEALGRAGLGGCIALSGIGKANAARAATELILSQRPDCIINSGCAGSVSKRVGVGDIVIGAQVAYHDVYCGGDWGVVEGCPQRFDADPQLLAVASGLLKSADHTGLICTGDQFFVSLEEDKRIKALYSDALACDMESAAIAQVCAHYGVPFLSLRVISDIHTSDSAQKASYEDFWRDISDRSFAFVKDFVHALKA